MTDHQNGQSSAPKAQGPGQAEASALRMGAQSALEAEEMAQAAMNEGEAALKGMQAGSREWMAWAQDAYQANAKAWQALLRCRTAQAALSIQAALLQEHIKLLSDNSRRMSTSGWMTAFSPKSGSHLKPA